MDDGSPEVCMLRVVWSKAGNMFSFMELLFPDIAIRLICNDGTDVTVPASRYALGTELYVEEPCIDSFIKFCETLREQKGET